MKIKLQVQVFIILINLYLCCFSLLGGLSTFSMSTMSLSSISSHPSSEWMKADGKDMIDSNGKSFKSHVGYIHSYVSLFYVSLSKFMLVCHLFLLKLFCYELLCRLNICWHPKKDLTWGKPWYIMTHPGI